MTAPPTVTSPTDPNFLRWRWNEWRTADPDSAQAWYHDLLDQEEYERRNHRRLTDLGFKPGRARHLLQILDLPIIQPCQPHPRIQPEPAPEPAVWDASR